MTDEEGAGSPSPESRVPSPGSGDPAGRVLEQFRAETAGGVSSRSDFERLKGKYLGREKGLVPGLFAGIRDLPREER
ncbi:MAG TPA: hypothetical protein VJ776_02305, partial [Thermoanaerobaculia bacterium]|nr:hypothetical protein [Thermoanaerobaculia bacterium]